MRCFATRLLLLIFTVFGLSSFKIHAQAIPQQPDRPLPQMRTIAEGPMSSVEKPFFAIARDQATYDQLLALGVPLPTPAADYFENHAIIAAFLGQRPTGGYSVEVIRRKNRFALRERRPPRGAMLTQAITAPFQVIEVTLPFEDGLNLDVDALWSKELRTYTITKGDFTTQGGFAGETLEFRLAGHIKTLAYGNLRTFVFDLKSLGGQEILRLNNAATGLKSSDNEFALPYLHANSFVKRPGNLLIAEAKFDLSQRKLSFTFKPLPNNIDDGYQGKGALTAVSVRR